MDIWYYILSICNDHRMFGWIQKWIAFGDYNISIYAGMNDPNVQNIFLGILLGGVIIGILSIFPGEPFDYEKDLQTLQNPLMHGREYTTNNAKNIDTYEQNEQEGDKVKDIENKEHNSTTLPSLQKSKQKSTDEPENFVYPPKSVEEIELEKAVSEVRIDKLKELLGMEEEEVKKMIEQAKQDALAGKKPTQSKGANLLWTADMIFYSVTISLLLYFMWKDYGINIIPLLDKYFPKELETLKQLNLLSRG